MHAVAFLHPPEKISLAPVLRVNLFVTHWAVSITCPHFCADLCVDLESF